MTVEHQIGKVRTVFSHIRPLLEVIGELNQLADSTMRLMADSDCGAAVVGCVTGFLERSVSLAGSINILVLSSEHHLNAWALVRMLLDRYIHLVYLSAKDEFDAFRQTESAFMRRDGEKLISAIMCRGIQSPVCKGDGVAFARDMSGLLDIRRLVEADGWQRPEIKAMLKTAFGADADMWYSMYQWLSGYVHPTFSDSDEGGDEAQMLRSSFAISYTTALLMCHLVTEGLRLVPSNEAQSMIVRVNQIWHIVVAVKR